MNKLGCQEGVLMNVKVVLVDLKAEVSRTTCPCALRLGCQLGILQEANNPTMTQKSCRAEDVRYLWHFWPCFDVARLVSFSSKVPLSLCARWSSLRTALALFHIGYRRIDADWAILRSTIKNLYMDQNVTLASTMKVMKEKHSFLAS